MMILFASNCAKLCFYSNYIGAEVVGSPAGGCCGLIGFLVSRTSLSMIYSLLRHEHRSFKIEPTHFTGVEKLN